MAGPVVNPHLHYLSSSQGLWNPYCQSPHTCQLHVSLTTQLVRNFNNHLSFSLPSLVLLYPIAVFFYIRCRQCLHSDVCTSPVSSDTLDLVC